MVPFKKIAVLEPNIVLGSQIIADIDAAIQTSLNTWLASALRHGMDGCYLRLHNSPPHVVENIVHMLSVRSVAAITPSSFKNERIRATAWHYREAEIIEKQDVGELVGKSCHSRQSVQDAAESGADYVFLSPIFPTKTHPDAVPLGLTLLSDICRQVPIPIFALGGIEESNAAACIEAGASGIAAIRMFMK